VAARPAANGWHPAAPAEPVPPPPGHPEARQPFDPVIGDWQRWIAPPGAPPPPPLPRRTRLHRLRGVFLCAVLGLCERSKPEVPS